MKRLIAILMTIVLGGEAGGEYADPYGSGRIDIIGEN